MIMWQCWYWHANMYMGNTMRSEKVCASELIITHIQYWQYWYKPLFCARLCSLSRTFSQELYLDHMKDCCSPAPSLLWAPPCATSCPRSLGNSTSWTSSPIKSPCYRRRCIYDTMTSTTSSRHQILKLGVQNYISKLRRRWHTQSLILNMKLLCQVWRCSA